MSNEPKVGDRVVLCVPPGGMIRGQITGLDQEYIYWWTTQNTPYVRPRQLWLGEDAHGYWFGPDDSDAPPDTTRTGEAPTYTHCQRCKEPFPYGPVATPHCGKCRAEIQMYG